mgnify:CR=1 FL=1
MDENLRMGIKKNSEELYRLYQEGKKLRLSNNTLAFLLLSAIEDTSNYFIEILSSKCENPTLMKNISARIYNRLKIKYELFLAIYYTMQNHDVETIIEKVKQLSSKWVNIKRGYIDVSAEELNEIETYYSNYVEMEKAILKLNKNESCYILNTLVQI